MAEGLKNYLYNLKESLKIFVKIKIARPRPAELLQILEKMLCF